MATYTDALVVYIAGKLKKIAASDELAISGDLEVGGDLTVRGAIISTSASNVVISDPFVDLNAGNVGTSGKASGLTFNVSAVPGTSGTISDFVPGDAAALPQPTPPMLTLSSLPSSAYQEGDIVQISGATEEENNGLFIIKAEEIPGTYSLYGVGGTAIPGYALFCQSQIKASAGQATTITKVNLAVLGVSDGIWVRNLADGTVVPAGSFVAAYHPSATVFNFDGNVTSPHYTSGDGYVLVSTSTVVTTLQNAYNFGNSISLQDTRDLLVSKPLSGSAALSLQANAASNITISDANLSLVADATAWTYASRNFATVNDSTYYSTLRAASLGTGGNLSNVEFVAAATLGVAAADNAAGGKDVTISFVDGITNNNTIDGLFQGITTLSVAEGVGGVLVVTTVANHGLDNGQTVTISGVVVTGGSGSNPNGTWVIANRTDTTFELVGSSVAGFTADASTGAVNLPEGSVLLGVLNLLSSSVSPNSLVSALPLTALQNGLGAGTALMKRGAVTLQAGGNVTGSGAAVVLDSPDLLSGQNNALFLHGSESVKISSDAGISAAVSASSPATVELSLTAGNVGTGRAHATVTADDRVSLIAGGSIIRVSSYQNSPVPAGIFISAVGKDTTVRALKEDGSGGTLTLQGDRVILNSTGEGQAVRIGKGTSPVLLGGQYNDLAPVGVPCWANENLSAGHVLFFEHNGAINSTGVSRADANGTAFAKDIVGIAVADIAADAEGAMSSVSGTVVAVKFDVLAAPTSVNDIGRPVFLSTEPGLASLNAPSEGRVFRVGVLFKHTVEVGAVDRYLVFYQPMLVADLTA